LIHLWWCGTCHRSKQWRRHRPAALASCFITVAAGERPREGRLRPGSQGRLLGVRPDRICVTDEEIGFSYRVAFINIMLSAPASCLLPAIPFASNLRPPTHPRCQSYLHHRVISYHKPQAAMRVPVVLLPSSSCQEAVFESLQVDYLAFFRDKRQCSTAESISGGSPILLKGPTNEFSINTPSPEKQPAPGACC